MTSTARRPRGERRSQPLPSEIWVLVVANVIIALGYGVVSPVLPAYARHFGVSIGATTFVITAFALMRLLFAPVSGLMVQRLGERRVYVGGLLIVAVSTAACAVAQSYWQLLLFRSIGGVGSTMFFISSLGLMIRISPPGARGRIAGLFSTAFLLGSIGGPVIGSLTAGLGLSAPFVIYGAAVLTAALVVFINLRHSRLAAPATESSEPAVTVREALRLPAYRAALLSNFATGWSVLGVRIALVPLFVTEVLARGPGMAGVTLATIAIGNISAVIPSGHLSDLVGRRLPLIVGLAAAGVATILLGTTHSLPLFLLAAYLSGAASGMFSAPQQAAVADILGSETRSGTAVATFQMMADLGVITGSVAIGQIAERLTFEWSFTVAGAILVLASLGWLLAPETRPGAVRPRVVRILRSRGSEELP
ncbi:MFS transporter [Mycobacterium sp. 1274756.6]|uniref:MFS transporter n=1 Tax=Mycobacterium sp. 1274756.6 TaxID=1834076 RepID=UPI0007FF9C31|nr:MFS transporter [Mycobacterium sp. 1274756.6]OBJ71451.1 MFS transporter permease [Mycobacterium sp. 1274756.6]